MAIDLDLLEHECAYHSFFHTAFGLSERPFALWRALPPSASGIHQVLRQVKIGDSAAHWFSPWRPGRDLSALKFAIFTRYTLQAVRRRGAQLAAPEHCPPAEAATVARWLAERRREGRPAWVDTQASLAVRACLAAQEEGLDISATLFRTGGEPLTGAKARIIDATGSHAVCHYTMGETGRIGAACSEQHAVDDVHLLTDKLAVTQRERPVGSNGGRVGALYYTSLLPSCPKAMINLESGDYGVIEERPCGCPFGELGMTLHLHDIRSFDKLTSEGNQFLGTDLLALIEEVLPGRFGGAPTDYQLVEEEVEGLPKVGIVVPPRLGDISDEDVVATVLAFLASEPRNRLMADVWRAGDTLRVVRREPHVSPAAKILALHVPSP
jgi:hypothetical protein